MKFEELLARADTLLPEIMPPGSASLVKAIDPQLAYPRHLRKILLRLRSPYSLLDKQDTRSALLSILHRSDAQALADLLGASAGVDCYSFLAKTTFKKASERKFLFDFFEIEVPKEDVRVANGAKTIVPPSFGLFRHQANALRQVEEYLNAPPHRALLHMPTGAGKTRTAMNIVANYLREKDRRVVVWLAHSEELCEQAASEFEKAWASLGIREVPLIRYWGNYDEDLTSVDDGVVVAGLKKAASRLKSDDRQFRALSTRNPLVVMDEAHQAIAPTYQMIINHLLRPLTDARLLGLSATPGRTWNDPEADRELAEYFCLNKVTLSVPGFDNPVSYLISQGYLANPNYVQIVAGADVSLSEEEKNKIKETFDLPASVLERLAEDEQRNLLIVHHAEQLLKRHKRVILFAASVQQSDLLSAVISARGFWSASITSKSPAGRSESIASFKDDSDEPKLLCNFGVLTTGFDAPRTSAALIARPTLSLVLYSQMVGRAMRGTAAGGNTNCEIVTVVDPNLPGFDSVVNAFTNWEDVWRNSCAEN